MEALKLRHCYRDVPFDPCERKDRSDARWWQNTFRELEADYAKPEEERQEVIWEMFPHALAENVLRILHHDPQNPNNIEPSTADVDHILKKLERIKAGKKTQLQEKKGVERSSYTQEQETICVEKKKVAGPNNPYKRFFQRPAGRAAIWQVLPPLKLEEMDMTQKSEAITEIIATDFVEWLKSIGGENKSSMDVATIKKMFEIGFQTHAATSLCVRVKEMPSVPEAVAKAHNEPDQSITAKLHQQLKRDVERTKAETKLFAFGTMLPLEIRHTPPKDNITDKWVHGNKIPQELDTMAAVWEGITNLRSTKAFCKWIMTHPELPHPKFLTNVGMLTTDFRKYSVDSKESYDPNFGKAILDD